LRLNKWSYVFFTLVGIAIVSAASAVYVFFFFSVGLSSADTARSLGTICNQTVVIVGNMNDYINDYSKQGISNSTFKALMVNLEPNMTALRTGLAELRNVAFPTYIRSIDLLDQGLQWLTDASGAAQNFDFNSASLFIEFGQQDIVQSEYVLPTA
jgi:hypothetical protein